MKFDATNALRFAWRSRGIPTSEASMAVVNTVRTQTSDHSVGTREETMSLSRHFLKSHTSSTAVNASHE